LAQPLQGSGARDGRASTAEGDSGRAGEAGGGDPAGDEGAGGDAGMISRSSVSGAFPTKPLGDVVEFLDCMGGPGTESERRAGPYRYYGANGQQGTIDDFIFDEPLVLLAEDGGHFGDPSRGIAYRVSGKTWVNNHAHVLRPNGELDLRFLCRVLENYDVTPWVTRTTRGKLTQAGA